MPQTLAQAHEALSRIRPGRAAPLSTWRAFRQLAARIYTEMADIDRFHHHEALYWAGYERGQAEEITRQLGLASEAPVGRNDNRPFPEEGPVGPR